MPDEGRPAVKVEIAGSERKIAEFAERARAGEAIELCQNGRPIARVIALSDDGNFRRPGRPGALRGQVYVAEDSDVLPDPEARALGQID